MTFDEQTKIKFWGNVEKTPGGCWTWKGSKLRGYGKFHAGGRMYIAHRVSWELVNGEIPPGTEIHHRCNNRACVNPSHLRAVSHRENMLEAASRGAWAGERNANAKRTEREVRAIRLLRAAKVSTEIISQQMEIPRRSVYYALEGWKHLES